MKAADVRLLRRIAKGADDLKVLIGRAEFRDLIGEWKGATGKPIVDDLGELAQWMDLKADAGERAAPKEMA